MLATWSFLEGWILMGGLKSCVQKNILQITRLQRDRGQNVENNCPISGKAVTRQYAPLQLASLCTDTVQCSDPHFRGVEIKVGNVKRYSPATEKIGQSLVKQDDQQKV